MRSKSKRSCKQRIHSSAIYNSSSDHGREEVDAMRTCCQWKYSGGKAKIGKQYLQDLPCVTESTDSFRLTYCIRPFHSFGGREETADA